jgi:hypothetical protein
VLRSHHHRIVSISDLIVMFAIVLRFGRLDGAEPL